MALLRRIVDVTRPDRPARSPEETREFLFGRKANQTQPGLAGASPAVTEAQNRQRLAVKRRKGRSGSILIGSSAQLGAPPVSRPGARSTLG